MKSDDFNIGGMIEKGARYGIGFLIIASGGMAMLLLLGFALAKLSIVLAPPFAP